jgi:hypothetical protein
VEVAINGVSANLLVGKGLISHILAQTKVLSKQTPPSYQNDDRDKEE